MFIPNVSAIHHIRKLKSFKWAPTHQAIQKITFQKKSRGVLSFFAPVRNSNEFLFQRQAQINCKREDIKYPGQSQILSSPPRKKSIKCKAPKITIKTFAKAESVVCTCSFSQSAGTIPAQTWENERERERKVRAKLSFEITDSVGCRQNRAVHCNRRWLESERVRARGGERASAGGSDCYQMLSHTHTPAFP